MEMNDHTIFIVGCGPGGADYVSPAAAQAVAGACTVLGSERLLRLFPETTRRQVVLPPAVDAAIQMMETHRSAGPTAVLVSGDPGMFSLAKPIIAHFGPKHCSVIPGISSLQIAYARLGLDWSDARIVSAHGRTPEVTSAELSHSQSIAIFGGTPEAAAWVSRIAAELSASHRLFVCEDLTLPTEKVYEANPIELRASELSSLVILILVRYCENL